MSAWNVMGRQLPLSVLSTLNDAFNLTGTCRYHNITMQKMEGVVCVCVCVSACMVDAYDVRIAGTITGVEQHCIPSKSSNQRSSLVWVLQRELWVLFKCFYFI